MYTINKKTLLTSAFLVGFIQIFLAIGWKESGVIAAGRDQTPQIDQEQVASGISVVFIPVAVASYPGYSGFSPFGAESNIPLLSGSDQLKRGDDLGLHWTRLGGRLSWRRVQPTEGAPIDWSKLAQFEEELIALKAAGIAPVVIVGDSPYWATVQPTSCAAIRGDKFRAFKSFMQAVVARYMQPKYNVHNWEIGNEPDVDPGLVDKDSVFGCWGNVQDEFYGGGHYGEMLKVIGPAIKQVDPTAKVWFGGLLLASQDSFFGEPELFLRGALAAGAAPYFDVLPYHWYPPYLNQTVDYDLIGQWQAWENLGGGTVGKARFLMDIMDDYGVSKPLAMNETSLMCPPIVEGQPAAYCNPPGDGFYQMQANYQVRSYVRGLSIDLMGISWYTLNGPGWRNTGLLDSQGQPRPSYRAMKHLIAELQFSKYIAPADYGAGLEAYAFQRGSEQVNVVWAIENTSKQVAVPKGQFIAAFNRDGSQLSPAISGDNYLLTVGFRPVYLILVNR